MKWLDIMSETEAKEEFGKSSVVVREETQAEKLKTTEQSQVYTATPDTLFSKKMNHTRTHALVSMTCVCMSKMSALNKTCFIK